MTCFLGGYDYPSHFLPLVANPIASDPTESAAPMTMEAERGAGEEEDEPRRPLLPPSSPGFFSIRHRTN